MTNGEAQEARPQPTMEPMLDRFKRLFGSDLASPTDAEFIKQAGELYHLGWQTAHDPRECGHPAACWQDRNYPASEQNYNPETHSSNPPMDYRCVICEILSGNGTTVAAGVAATDTVGVSSPSHRLCLPPSQPTICGKPVGMLIPGTNFACVLEPGHGGDCQQGGTCFAHGRYVGQQCPQWPKCASEAKAEAVPPSEEAPTGRPIAEWTDTEIANAVRSGLQILHIPESATFGEARASAPPAVEPHIFTAFDGSMVLDDSGMYAAGFKTCREAAARIAEDACLDPQSPGHRRYVRNIEAAIRALSPDAGNKKGKK